MAKTGSGARRRDSAQQHENVPDQVVSQVGRAAARIMKLRLTYEQTLAAAASDEERESLAGKIESEAVHAISDQGLTVHEYNKVIEATEVDPALEERVMLAYQVAA
jgi:hypothetical protein